MMIDICLGYRRRDLLVSSSSSTPLKERDFEVAEGVQLVSRSTPDTQILNLISDHFYPLKSLNLLSRPTPDTQTFFRVLPLDIFEILQLLFDMFNIGTWMQKFP